MGKKKIAILLAAIVTVEPPVNLLAADAEFSSGEISAEESVSDENGILAEAENGTLDAEIFMEESSANIVYDSDETESQSMDGFSDSAQEDATSDFSDGEEVEGILFQAGEEGLIFDVTDFGANGADLESDQQAIQCALNEALKTDEIITVNIPAGTYYLDRTLTVFSNTNLFLDENAVMVRTDDSIVMLDGSAEGEAVGGYNDLVNVTISGGVWDGNVTELDEKGYGKKVSDLLYFWHGNNLKISNTTLKNCCGYHFLEVAAISDCVIENVHFENYIRYTGTDYSSIDGTISDSDSFTDSDESLIGTSISSEALQIDYAEEVASPGAVPFDNTPCKNIIVQNCTFNNCLGGVGNHHSDVSTLGVRIIGNKFVNMSGSCINLPNMQNTIVSDNTAEKVYSFIYSGEGTVASIIDNTAEFDASRTIGNANMLNCWDSRIIFDHNTVIGSSLSVLYTRNAEVVLENNTFSKAGTSAVDVYKTVITAENNSVTEAGMDAFHLREGSSGEISGNTITVTGQNGIALESTGNVTISANSITDATGNGIIIDGSEILSDDETAEPGESTVVPQITVTNNTVDRSGLSALYVKNAEVNLSDNEFNDAGASAIDVYKTVITAKSNTISNSGMDAFHLREGSSGEISGNTITVPGQNGIALESTGNVTITANSITDATDNGITVDGSVLLSGGTIDSLEGIIVPVITVTNNTVTGVGLSALYVKNAEVNLSDNEFNDAGASAVDVYNTDIAAKNNTVSNSGLDGFYLREGSSGEIFENTIITPGQTGISLENAGNIAIRSNTITGSVKNGILLNGVTSQSEVSDNMISNSEDSGIRMANQSNAVLKNNRINGSTYAGINVNNSSVEADGNIIEEPGTEGFYITNGSSGVISNNRISNAKQTAIVLTGTNQFSVFNNVIISPGMFGISAVSAQDKLSIKANTISDSVKDGMYIASSSGEILDNVISNAGENGIRLLTLTDMTLRNNEINDSAQCGISVVCSEFAANENKIMNSGYYGIFVKGGTVEILKNIVKGSTYHDIFVFNDTDNNYISTGNVSDNIVSESGVNVVDTVNESGTILESEVTSLDNVTLIKACVIGKSIKITWEETENATSYQVYRRTADTGWKTLISDAGNVLEYTDDTVQEDITYYYTVRAKRGSIVSPGWDDKGVHAVVLTKLDNVVLKDAYASGGGIKVIWEPVINAETYQVYRKTTGGGWSLLTKTAVGNSYTDTTVKNDITYIYTVRAMNGTMLSPSWDDAGVRAAIATKLDNVELVSASASSAGIKVVWKEAANAAAYQIFRKTKDTGWKTITSLAKGNSYLDENIEQNVTYTYTVRALNNGVISPGWDNKGVTAAYVTKLDNVILEGARPGADGIEVGWKAVDGAVTYQVYRRTAGNGWKLITNTAAGTSYIDKNILKNTTYFYTVRAMNGKLLSPGWDDSGVSAILTEKLDNVKLIGASVSAGAIQVTWEAVSGAYSYQIYRKTEGTGWKLYTNILGKTSFTDKNVVKNIKYTYTVRAVSGSVLSPGWDDHGVSAAIVDTLANVKLVSANAQGTGIKVSWEAVSNAITYQVYRRTAGSGWSLLTSKAEGTSYIDNSISKDIPYTYTVRGVNGLILSPGWDNTGVTATAVSKLDNVVLISAVYGENGITVNWKSVEGAVTYQIYRKTSSGGWKCITNTAAGESYVDSDVAQNTLYTYTVRAMCGNVLSPGWDDKGVSAVIQ